MHVNVAMIQIVYSNGEKIQCNEEDINVRQRKEVMAKAQGKQGRNNKQCLFILLLCK